jgi:hypothetical protein
VRTTLTLDDDIANLLNKEIRRSGISFKEGVNRYLRIGLMTSKRQIRKPFVVTPRPLGLPPGLSYDRVEELLESIEGDAYR